MIDRIVDMIMTKGTVFVFLCVLLVGFTGILLDATVDLGNQFGIIAAIATAGSCVYYAVAKKSNDETEE